MFCSNTSKVFTNKQKKWMPIRQKMSNVYQIVAGDMARHATNKLNSTCLLTFWLIKTCMYELAALLLSYSEETFRTVLSYRRRKSAKLFLDRRSAMPHQTKYIFGGDLHALRGGSAHTCCFTLSCFTLASRNRGAGRRGARSI